MDGCVGIFFMPYDTNIPTNDGIKIRFQSIYPSAKLVAGRLTPVYDEASRDAQSIGKVFRQGWNGKIQWIQSAVYVQVVFVSAAPSMTKPLPSK